MVQKYKRTEMTDKTNPDGNKEKKEHNVERKIKHIY